MRALRAHALDGPAGLWVDEVEEPGPESVAPTAEFGAVRIRVCAAGVGFADTLVTRGLYQIRQQPPFTPGMEVAGVVESAPDGSDLAVGTTVYACPMVGGCAEIVWAASHLVAPLPPGLDFATGAAFGLNEHTAYLALTRRGGLRAGETVLVHGAGGGVGSALVRIAAGLGGRVLAVASSPEKRAVALRSGASEVFGPDEWFDAVRAAGGADLIADVVGGDVFDASLRALAPEGRLLTLGYAAGRIPSAPANRLLLRNADVRGMNIYGLQERDPGLFRATATEIAALLAAGRPPEPPVVYDLADGAQAFAALEERRLVGKAVLRLD